MKDTTELVLVVIDTSRVSSFKAHTHQSEIFSYSSSNSSLECRSASMDIIFSRPLSRTYPYQARQPFLFVFNFVLFIEPVRPLFFSKLNVWC